MHKLDIFLWKRPNSAHKQSRLTSSVKHYLPVATSCCPSHVVELLLQWLKMERALFLQKRRKHFKTTCVISVSLVPSPLFVSQLHQLSIILRKHCTDVHKCSIFFVFWYTLRGFPIRCCQTLVSQERSKAASHNNQLSIIIVQCAFFSL